MKNNWGLTPFPALPLAPLGYAGQSPKSANRFVPFASLRGCVARGRGMCCIQYINSCQVEIAPLPIGPTRPHLHLRQVQVSDSLPKYDAKIIHAHGYFLCRIWGTLRVCFAKGRGGVAVLE